MNRIRPEGAKAYHMFIVLTLLILLSGTVTGITTDTQWFNTTGADTWTVPTSVPNVTIEVWGASGTAGGASGANGGYAKVSFNVSSGETLYLYVGEQGGGGAGGSVGSATAGDGGNLSYVRLNQNIRATTLAVGGGGGGGGDAASPTTATGAGGAGGANTASSGAGATAGSGPSQSSATGGGGGDQSSGGTGQEGGATNGGAGTGGSGGTASTGSSDDAAGGGGGAGWYGGGGGGAAVTAHNQGDSASGAGGGGGSNFINTTASRFLEFNANQSGVNANNGGAGVIKLSWVQLNTAPTIHSSVTYNGTDYNNLQQQSDFLRSDRLTLRSSITDGSSSSIDDVLVTIRNTTGHVNVSNATMTNISAFSSGGDSGGTYEYNFSIHDSADIGEWSYTIRVNDTLGASTASSGTFDVYEYAFLNISFFDSTLLEADLYNLYNITANVTCSGNSADAECGNVLSDLRYSDFDLEPENVVGGSGTPFFITEGPLVEVLRQGISTQLEWNDGIFDGTSTDRADNDGTLGIGYLNGTASGQSNDNGLNNGSLVGYWRLDRTSGSVIDYSGNANDGTDTGATRGASGVFGTNAFRFEGDNSVDDFVNVSHDPSLNSDDATVSFWVKPRGNNTNENYQSYVGMEYGHQWMVGKDDGTDRFRWHINTTGSDFQTHTEYTFTNGNWYHLAFTYDSGTGDWSKYVDGNLIHSETLTGTLENPNTPLQIGNDPQGNNQDANATIDEVRVYNRPLSVQEIKRLYFNTTDDKYFGGNYTSEKIDTSSSQTWTALQVNASVLGQTDLDAVFRALESGGSVVDSQVINIADGRKNYTLSISDSEDAEVVFNGTSTNESRTWGVGGFKLYGRTAHCKSTTSGDTCRFTWTINASQRGTFNLDANFSSDASWITENDTENKKVETDPAFLNISFFDSTLLEADLYNVYNITANVTCSGDPDTECGTVTGELRSSDFDMEPVNKVWSGAGSPFYVDNALAASSQDDFNTGSFNGTSAGREANGGSLGLGYLNGTRSGQSYDNGLNNASLVGYWRFDRTTGDVPDYSGTGNDGTNYEAVRGVQGVFGTNAFNFQRDNSNHGDNVRISTFDLPSGTGSYAISAWFKTTSHTSSNGDLIIWGTPTNGQATGLSIISGDLRFTLWGNDLDVTPSKTVTDGEWHHVVGVHDDSVSNEFKLYLDGQLEGEGAREPDISPSEAAIGGNVLSPGNFFTGDIDEIRVYNRSLSTAEVRNLYFYGGDGTFDGNYTRTFDTAAVQQWDTLTVNASLPTGTAATLNFTALDTGGSVVGSEMFTVLDGVNTHRLSVSDSEDAKIMVNGTSTDAGHTWEIHRLEVNGNPLTCSTQPLTEGDTCSLTWAVNASQRGSFNLDVNFSSDASWVDANDTENKKVETDPAFLNISYFNTTTWTADLYDVLTVSANVTCSGDSNTECGAVSGELRHNNFDMGPDTGVPTGTGSKPFFINDVFRAASQSQFNTGSFSGTSADRSDNSGTLGIGYRNGTQNVGLEEGLMQYYRMDVDASDYSGNDNEVVLGNTPIFEDIGVFGTSGADMAFQNHVNISDARPARITIAGWVKPEVVPAETTGPADDTFVALEATTGSNLGVLFGLNASLHLEGYAGTSGSSASLLSSTALEKGKWYHVALTYDGGTASLYINGSQADSASLSGDLSYDPSRQSNLGVWDTGFSNPRWFEGWMDEFRIYNRSLSAGEIQQLYFHGGDGVFEGNYTRLFDTEETQEWTSLSVNASIPEDTAATLNFTALDTGGSLVDTQIVSLKDGFNTYPLTLTDSEDAKVIINGTTTDVVKSWEIHDLDVNGNPAPCSQTNLLYGQTCSLSWVVNASQKGGFNLDTNIFSDADWVEENDTADKQVNVDLGWLNVSLLTPSTTGETVFDKFITFWLNATITCEGDPGDVCGDVTGSARYNEGDTPDTVIEMGQGTPFYTRGSRKQNTTGTHGEWKKGTFNGTSTDRNQDYGRIGLGYLNGTRSGQGVNSGLNGLNLVGYWRMDKTSGSVIDYSGTGNDGTNNGADRGSQGVFGTNASSFTRSESDTVGVSISDLPSGTGSYTVSAWFKTESHTNNVGTMIMWGTANTDQSTGLALDQGNPRFILYGGDLNANPSQSMVDGTWHHLVGVHNDSASNEFKIYVDGVFETEAAREPDIGTSDAAIGGNVLNGVDYWNGELDEIRVYNRSLSAAEVKQLYFHGGDGTFDGNYTSENITRDVDQSWNDLQVDASVPTDTALNVVFQTLDDTGTVTDEDVISVQDGVHNYSVDVQNAKNARWIINGTTTDAAKSWEVEDITTRYGPTDVVNPQTCSSALSQGQSCTLNWAINASGTTNTDWLLDTNFDSEHSPAIVENDTDDAKVCIGSCPSGGDTDAPDWRNQQQNTSSISSGNPVKLAAQGNDTALDFAVLATNETGTWENKTGNYSSPMQLGTSNTWTWSNFTWRNDSVGSGAVGWRVWYNDTSSNWNGTDIGVFTIPEFQVDILDTNEPVFQGETLEVEFNVTNKGDTSTTQTIELAYNESSNVVDTYTTGTLGTDDWENGSLTYAIPSDENPDDYEIWVFSDDDNRTDNVTVVNDTRMDNLITNFTEDNPLSHWSGDTGSYSVETDNPFQGDQHLFSAASAFRYIKSTDGDGLNSYPDTNGSVRIAMWFHPNVEDYDTRLYLHNSVDKDIYLEVGNNAGGIRMRAHNATHRVFNSGNSFDHNNNINRWIRAVIEWNPDTNPSEDNLKTWLEGTDGQQLSNSLISGQLDAFDSVPSDTVQIATRMPSSDTAGIDYDHLEWEYLDGAAQTYDKNVTEGVLFAESDGRDTTRNILESSVVALGDSFGDVFSGLRVFDAFISHGETIPRLFDGVRTFTEDISAVFDQFRVFDGLRVFSDDVNYVGTTGTTGLLARDTTDTVAYTATISRTFTGLRTVSEMVNVGVDLARDGTFTRTFSATITYTSELSRVFTGDRILSEGVVLEDGFSSSSTLGREFTESMAYGSGMVREFVGTRLFTQATRYGDSFLRNVDSVRLFDTGMTITDDVVRSVAIGRVFDASYGYVDGLSRTVTGSRLFADSITYGDAVFGGQISSRLFDAGVTYTGAVVRGFTGFRGLEETIAFDSVLLQEASLSRAFGDTYSYAGSLSRTFTGTRIFSDGVLFATSADREAVNVRSFSDAASYGTEIIRVFFGDRQLSTVVGYTDVLVRSFTGSRRVTEGVTFDTSLAAGAATVRMVQDVFEYGTGVAREFVGARLFSDEFVYTADSSLQQTVGRVIGDGVTYTAGIFGDFTGFRAVTTQIGVDATVKRVGTFARLVTGGFGFGSADFHTVFADRQLFEDVSVTGAVTRSGSMDRLFDASITYVSDVAGDVKIIRFVSESVSYGEAVLRSFTGDRSRDEPYRYISGLSRTVTGTRVITGTVQFSTALDAGAATVRIIEDAVAYGADVVRTVTNTRQFGQVLRYTDAVIRGFSGDRVFDTGIRYQDGTAVERQLGRSFDIGVTYTASVLRRVTGVRVTADSMQYTGNVVRDAALNRVFGGTYGYITSFSRVFSGQRSIFQAVTAESTFSLDAQTVRILTDAVSYGESLSRSFTGFRQFADTVSYADGLLRTGSFSRVAADTVSYIGTVSRTFDGLRIVGDMYTFGESLVGEPLSRRGLTETLDYGAGVTRGFAGTRLLTGTYDYIADAGKGNTFTKFFNSVYGVSDDLSRSFTGSRLMSGTFSLVDSAIRGTTLARFTGDSYGFENVVDRAVTLGRGISDRVGYGDIVSRIVSGNRVVNGDVSVTTTVATMSDVMRTVSQPFGVVTGIGRSFVGDRFLLTTYDYASGIASGDSILKVFSDVFRVSSELSRGQSLTRLFAERVLYVGEIIPGFTGIHVLEETYSVTAETSTEKSLTKSLSDAFTVLVGEERVASLDRLFAQPFDLFDSVLRGQTGSRSVTGFYAVDEGVQRSAGLGRVVTQSFDVVVETVRASSIGRTVNTVFDYVFDASRDGVMTRSFDQPIRYVDAVGRQFSGSFLVGQSVLFADELAADERVIKIVTDSVRVVSDRLRSVSVFRVFVDSFSFLDLLEALFSGDDTDGDTGGDTGDDTSGGSGGGGGGFLGGLFPSDVPGLKLLTENQSMRLNPGERTDITVSFENNGSAQGTYFVRTSRNLAAYVSPQDASRRLQAGEPVSVEFDVVLPENTTPRTVTGYFNVSVNDKSRRVPVALIVKSVDQEELLDVRTRLENLNISVDEELQYTLEIFNMGQTDRVDIEVISTVENDTGVLLRRSETLAAQTSVSIVRTIDHDLKPGGYLLNVVARYANKTAIASTTFDVHPAPTDTGVAPVYRSLFRYGGMVVLLVVLSGLVFGGYRLYQRRETESQYDKLIRWMQTLDRDIEYLDAEEREMVLAVLRTIGNEIDRGNLDSAEEHLEEIRDIVKTAERQRVRQRVQAYLQDMEKK